MISETTMEGLADELLESKYNSQPSCSQIQTLLRGKDSGYADRVRYKATGEFLEDLDRYIHSLRKSNVRSDGVKVSVYTVSAADVRRHFQRRFNLSFSEQLNGVTATIVEQISQPIDQHMLYVALTRAMHSLVVTYCEAILKFLNPFDSSVHRPPDASKI